MRRLALVLAIPLAAALFACDTGDTEETSESMKKRMKEMEKKAKESLPKTQELALKQTVAPETLRQVQQQLAVLREYLDEPTGKMDFVTVNAIEAFQLHVGLPDDGQLTDETLSRLRQEATAEESARKTGGTSYWRGRG
jgi:peptidoglycan hydrolase-like protein with peptidoglycan-binding domain